MNRDLDYALLTSPAAGEARAAGSLLILPVGATEQHGHGLPLGTDTLRAQHLADRVAAALTGRARVLPALPYGVSPHHTGLPGTITVDPMVFIELVYGLARGLADSGWPALLIINGHGGNHAALGVVQQRLIASHPDFHFAHSQITPLARAANAALDRGEISGHSGESETAQMLAIDPDLIDRDHLSPGATRLADLGAKAALSRRGQPSLAVPFHEYAPNGVLGDPTRVTAAEGERILAEAEAALVDFATALLAL